jgi:hypothetical protein
MDWGEFLGDVLTGAAKGLVSAKVLKQLNAWMATDYDDLAEMDESIREYVFASSNEELKVMDKTLRDHVKANAFNRAEFDKAMSIFASLHGAWLLRAYLQSK